MNPPLEVTGRMVHQVFCYECRKYVQFEAAGDLGQYGGDTFECPCDREETVVPKHISDQGDYALFDVASLEPPGDLGRFLRLAEAERESTP